jgi:hypothetical protein
MTSTTLSKIADRIPVLRVVLAASAIAGALYVQTGPASAASASVQNACMSDYFSHCSQHDPDSKGVRTCMRNVGSRLSKDCISALQAAGEIPAKSSKTARR